MRLFYSIRIYDDEKGSGTILHKVFEGCQPPPVGAYIEDAAWEDVKLPTQVIVNYGEGFCMLQFGLIEGGTAFCEQADKVHRFHGWHEPN